MRVSLQRSHGGELRPKQWICELNEVEVLPAVQVSQTRPGWETQVIEPIGCEKRPHMVCCVIGLDGKTGVFIGSTDGP